MGYDGFGMGNGKLGRLCRVSCFTLAMLLTDDSLMREGLGHLRQPANPHPRKKVLLFLCHHPRPSYLFLPANVLYTCTLCNLRNALFWLCNTASSLSASISTLVVTRSLCLKGLRGALSSLGAECTVASSAVFLLGWKAKRDAEISLQMQKINQLRIIQNSFEFIVLCIFGGCHQNR